jgi:hypothetical protein
MVKLECCEIPVVTTSFALHALEFYELQLPFSSSTLLGLVGLVGLVVTSIFAFARTEFRLPSSQPLFAV